VQYPLLHYRSQQGSCQGREQHQAAMDICLLAIPMMVIRLMRMRKNMMMINDGDDDSE